MTWGLDGPPIDLPDVTDGIPCCMGYAVSGPAACTCWEPIYAPDAQALPDRAAPTETMPARCSDCAYRRDSPERRSDPTAMADADDLDRLPAAGIPFWCHDGLPRILAYAHPSGAVIALGATWVSHYAPPVVDGRPYRADGRPAALCAGWAAARARHLKAATR